MVSEKMKGFMANSSAIRAMFEEGKKMAAIYGKENVYDFSLGNPSVEPPPQVKKALLEVLETEDQNFVHGYTNNSGYEDVRQAVADITNEKYHTSISMENIVMTSGAAAGLNIILKTLLNPGDEVLVFAPYFGEYNSYVKNYDGIVKAVPANIESFQINFPGLEAMITSKTKALILNSPNNPTGVVYSEATLIKLASFLRDCQKKYGHNIYLISDEPYRELVYDGIDVPYPANYFENTFVSYSFSKSLSLPGERIGYIIVNNEVDDFEDIMKSLNVANRICGFVNAPSLFQRIVPLCMETKVDIEIYDKNRRVLYEKLMELGFSCVRPQGAFYMFPKTLIVDDIAFCEAAKEFQLLLVPGTSFGCPGHFRLSYCISYDTILRSFDSFEKLAEKYRR